MLTCGIVAEFNPFHDGHAELLKRVRNELHPDQIVVVLSQWFSSRGLPCLLSVEDKTRMALEAGADLVIALPAIYAMQSADYFALYAIEALKSAGVNMICFGSESADLDDLKEKAKRIESLEADVTTSLARNAQSAGLALRPNDILAIQYIRHASSFGIDVHAFLRNQNLKSATAIRKDFFDGHTQKGDALYHAHQSWSSYYPYLRMQLMMSSPATLRSFFLVEEGIEYRLKDCARNNDTFDGFLNDAISRTYSKARIQRTCMMILMQIDKTEMKDHQYFFDVIVLGMNQTGRELLKSLPKGTSLCSRWKDVPQWLAAYMHKEEQLYSLIDGAPAKWSIVRL